MEAASKILVAPYTGDTLLPCAKSFGQSFEIENEFPGLAVVEELEKMACPYVFHTTDRKKPLLNDFFM